MRNFYEILDSNDFRWLLIDFNENSDIELTMKRRKKQMLKQELKRLKTV